MKKNQVELDILNLIEKHQKTVDMQILGRMFLDTAVSIYLNVQSDKFTGMKKIILNLWNSIEKV